MSNTYPVYPVKWAENPDPFNHGKTWTSEHKQQLLDEFVKGTHLKELASMFGRKLDSIVAKLFDLKLLIRTQCSFASYNYIYYVNLRFFEVKGLACPYLPNKAVPTTTLSQPKEATMSNDTNVTIVTIETKTLINGVDGAELSDEQIFNRIAKIEAQIKTWASIENKPKKLLAKIDEAKASIAALVSYVDGR
jgi:hypothetical protein